VSMLDAETMQPTPLRALLTQLRGPLPQRVISVDTNEKTDEYRVMVSALQRDLLISILQAGFEPAKPVPQFELPDGLPLTIDSSSKVNYGVVKNANGLSVATAWQEGWAQRIAAIPAMVEEIGRLRGEKSLNDTLIEQNKRFAREIESLRALNAELREQLVHARTILRTFGGEQEADATELMRGIDAVLAKCESQSATTQPRTPGLPAQAPLNPPQPAPGGISETESDRQ
jgi:hypothetical protein